MKQQEVEMANVIHCVFQTSCISRNQSGTAPALVRHLTSSLFGEGTREATLVLAFLALQLAIHGSWAQIKEGMKWAYHSQPSYSPFCLAYIWTPLLGWECPIIPHNHRQQFPAPSRSHVQVVDSTKVQESEGEGWQTWVVTCTMCEVTMQLALSDRAQRWTYEREEKPQQTNTHNSHTAKRLQKCTPCWYSNGTLKLVTGANILPPVQKGNKLQKRPLKFLNDLNEILPCPEFLLHLTQGWERPDICFLWVPNRQKRWVMNNFFEWIF